MINRIPTVIAVDNVNQAFYYGIRYIRDGGIKVATRNGPCLKSPGTLITHYRKPNQRMLLVAGRDANPFFHCFESLWMLSGSNKVEYPAYYVPSMRNYSDDGETFNAAYGYRWATHFSRYGIYDIDQIEIIVEILHKDPDSRRVVLQMWDPEADLLGGRRGLKDTACNLLVKYSIQDGYLNASVCCRSNDMVLGGYGANAVHFSFLQEYLVDRLRLLGMDVRLGFYEQISMDAHVYTELYSDKLWSGVERELEAYECDEERAHMYFEAYESNYKGDVLYTLSPLLLHASIQNSENPTSYRFKTDPKIFQEELQVLVANPGELPNEGFSSPYLKHIITPMVTAYELYKQKDLPGAKHTLELWRQDLSKLFMFKPRMRLDIEVACSEWIERRLSK
jgi:thymidylate synthase